MVDDAELDRLMRDSLERRAADVDVAAPVARKAVAAVRRRHRGRVAVGFAAASVAAVAVIATLDSTPPTPPEPEGGGPVAVDLTGEWRTEYWRDVQVDVPADWAWGVTPRVTGDGHLSFCGGVGDRPYVGRPIPQSDLCIAKEPTPVPTEPYVWLDAKVPPGMVDLGDGWTQETLDVGTSTVTVAADDEQLRERIVGSVQEADLCAPHLAEPPTPRRDWTIEGVGRFREARVCAYESGGGGFKLTYASPLTEVDIDQSYAALDEAPDSDLRCKATSEFVIVSAVYEDPYSPDPGMWLMHDTVFDMDCGNVALQTPLDRRTRLAEITEDSVQPWANEATRAIVCWGAKPWASTYFLQGWC